MACLFRPWPFVLIQSVPYGLVGWWHEAQFARLVRVGAVAPSQAPGEGGGSCKDPKGRSLSASGAAGRLDGEEAPGAQLMALGTWSFSRTLG